VGVLCLFNGNPGRVCINGINGSPQRRHAVPRFAPPLPLDERWLSLPNDKAMLETATVGELRSSLLQANQLDRRRIRLLKFWSQHNSSPGPLRRRSTTSLLSRRP